mgnify:CR=1 FL=1
MYKRQTGGSGGAVSGAILGGGIGGLIGLGTGLENRGSGVNPAAMGLLGAGLGGGIGYLAGRSGDKAQDARTLEARQLLKLSPQERAKVLKYRTAAHLDYDDDQDRQYRDQRRYEKSNLRREKALELRSRRLARTRRPRY